MLVLLGFIEWQSSCNNILRARRCWGNLYTYICILILESVGEVWEHIPSQALYATDAQRIYFVTQKQPSGVSRKEFIILRASCNIKKIEYNVMLILFTYPPIFDKQKQSLLLSWWYFAFPIQSPKMFMSLVIHPLEIGI